MLEEKEISKLIELTKRAISINEKLLEEEKKFVEYLSQHPDISELQSTTDLIATLVRKEVLYSQVAKRLIEINR